MNSKITKIIEFNCTKDCQIMYQWLEINFFHQPLPYFLEFWGMKLYLFRMLSRLHNFNQPFFFVFVQFVLVPWTGFKFLLFTLLFTTHRPQYQFHQHLKSSFCVNTLAPKKSKPKISCGWNLFKKAAHKILVKMTPEYRLGLKIIYNERNFNLWKGLLSIYWFLKNSNQVCFNWRVTYNWKCQWSLPLKIMH